MPAKSAAKSTIVVFAGAGASTAVDADAYPTTAHFFDRLPDKIRSHPMFRAVHGYLTSQKGKEVVIDIELMLWHLQELRDNFSRCLDRKTITGALIQEGSKLAQGASVKNATFGNFTQVAEGAVKNLNQLTLAIHELVYDFYGSEPDRERLEDTWLPLLRPLVASKACVEVVTTNYDLVLEHALDFISEVGHDAIDDGWRGKRVTSLDTQLWTDRNRPVDAPGLLTKLHGSVNWSRNGAGRINVSDPGYKGSHNRHAIIYPGFKGRPNDAEFLAFHNYFAGALSRASGIIFVGFAFRDEYINDICDRSIARETPIVLIDPVKPKSVPLPPSSLHHISKGFDANAAMEAVELILRNKSG